jgi:hypothetical protein
MISRGARAPRSFLPICWAFDGTVILLAIHILCFRCVPLLSCDYSRVTWITLSLKFFLAAKASVCLVDFALRGFFFCVSSADIRLSLCDTPS